MDAYRRSAVFRCLSRSAFVNAVSASAGVVAAIAAVFAFTISRQRLLARLIFSLAGACRFDLAMASALVLYRQTPSELAAPLAVRAFESDSPMIVLPRFYLVRIGRPRIRWQQQADRDQ